MVGVSGFEPASTTTAGDWRRRPSIKRTEDYADGSEERERRAAVVLKARTSQSLKIEDERERKVTGIMRKLRLHCV